MTTRPAVVAAAPNADLNVTPMLDVLLVLLIIFMAVTITTHRTIDANLAQPCAAGCANGSSIVLEVLPGGVYRLNHQPVPGPELADRLRDVYRERPDKILEVAGRAGVKYQDVIEAMDVAKGAGVLVLGVSPRERR